MATMKGGTQYQKALSQIARQLKQGGVVRVGFLEKAKYPDGTSVALVAAVQNFGSLKRGIPPRPFFTNMINDKSSEWPKAVALNLKATGYDTVATLKRMGDGIKGQLQQSIRDTNMPPLKPATIRAKGFSKPLVHSGHMMNSVDYEVKT